MHTILLLHGVMASRINLRRNQRDLEDLGWPVVALDLPGHGGRRAAGGSADSLDAMARDVAARLDDGTTYLVVGHSLGAIVGLHLASSYPDLVGGVVLEDPPGLASINPARLATEVHAAAQRARDRPAAEISSLLQSGSTWSRQDADDAIRSRQAFDIAAINRFLTSQRWDLPALVAECPVPVQLIAATEPGSALKPPDRERVIALIHPDHVRIVESGHSIHRDRPGIWLHSIVAFGESLERRAEIMDRSHDRQ